MKKFSPLLGEPAVGVVNDLIAEVERLQDLVEEKPNTYEYGMIEGFSYAYALFKQGIEVEDLGKMTPQQVKEKYFPMKEPAKE